MNEQAGVRGAGAAGDLVAIEDPYDRRVARSAEGRLAELNLAGLLVAADVHVALRLGRLGPETDERVLLAVALTVRAVRNGSVCLDLATVAELAPELLAPVLPDVAAWLTALRASPLVGEGCPLRLEEELLYLDRYWLEEVQVVRDLHARGRGAPVVDEQRLDAALSAYFPQRQYADQRAAAETACRQWTAVVTGGPGTGKTTTVARLLGVLLDLHGTDGQCQPLRVALAAPTGKAAARMGEAVRSAADQPGFPEAHRGTLRGLESVTLHRLLGTRPDNRTRFRRHRGNQLPHDVVVVDETSMVSLSMMARLVEAVRPDARLVLVGDADQLASVDAGAVLKDLVEGLDPGQVGRLGPTRRFGPEIAALAAAIRTGDQDAVLEALTVGEAVRRVEPGDLQALLVPPALELHAACEAGDEEGAMRLLERHRLLCAHREGPAGAGWWNRQVERWLMAALGRDWLPRWYPGQPFIVNSNDYGLGLFNGDTGVVCADAASPGGLRALVSTGATGSAAGATATWRPFALSRLSDVGTAHAMTVHRGQGSQFDRVTVLLPDADSRALTRQLFYTAVTRARTEVRVVGDEAAVRAAVERQAQRATGLARRLRD